ncbi:MAG TPA: bL28 family ribosomal protein [Anaerolineales bacterium]|nr:bL28 family ribosomal protein [Anaerolineales bacterium]
MPPASEPALIVNERIFKMAKCAQCGKTTTFGRNRPWSKKSTPRTYRPNLQPITVYMDGRKVRKVLCAKCIRTLVKTS